MAPPRARRVDWGAITTFLDADGTRASFGSEDRSQTRASANRAPICRACVSKLPAAAIFHRTYSLFSPNQGNDRRQHARSRSSLDPSPPSSSFHTLHADGRRSLDSLDLIPNTLSPSHVKEFGRAYLKAKMAMSFANSSAVPGANAQTSNGDEIPEIVVEVSLCCSAL